MPRIDADGVELFYESLGEGTPLILQAHDHTPWMFFQAPIFSQTYRFVTFDRRGTGRSASPAGEWSVPDWARDLRALMASRPGQLSEKPRCSAASLTYAIAASAWSAGRCSTMTAVSSPNPATTSKNASRSSKP